MYIQFILTLNSLLEVRVQHLLVYGQSRVQAVFSTENDSYVRAVAGSWGQHYSLIASIELNDNHSGMIRSTAYHHPGHAFDTESIPRLLPVVLGNLTEMLRVVLALELLVGIQNWPRHLVKLQADVKKKLPLDPRVTSTTVILAVGTGAGPTRLFLFS